MARVVFRIFYLFIPVKRNSILFCSFSGMQYTCNPKYIFESLYSRFGRRYEYVWVLDNREKLPGDGFGKDRKVQIRKIYISHDAFGGYSR